MTLVQAMAAEKRWGGEGSIDDHTPPAADFVSNINKSNRMSHNHLVAPAAAVATVSAVSSMRKRVMKRAGDIFQQSGIAGYQKSSY
jgi:hypothetical protein